MSLTGSSETGESGPTMEEGSIDPRGELADH